jgi:hypothetical protein
MTDKIKILFLAASPIDIHQLQSGKEAREFEAEIRASSRREHFELETHFAMPVT